MILASDDGHKKVFPVIGFKINKNSKEAHLVRSQLPVLDEGSRSKPCGEKYLLVIYVKI